MEQILRYAPTIVLVLILVLSIVSTIPIVQGMSNNYSSGLTDVYTPRKGLIIERNPIRIVYFGEVSDKDENATKYLDGVFVHLIKTLGDLNSTPTFPMNDRLEIHIDTGVRSDSTRQSHKGINVGVQDANK